MLETGVGTVVTFRGEPHSGAVAATGTSLLVVSSAGVPRETDKDGAVAAIIVLVILLETGSDLVVDLLVVVLGGGEDLGGGGGTLVVEVISGTTCNDGTCDVEQGRCAGGLGRL